MSIALIIGVIIFAYLLGSVNFAVIFTNVFSKTDVRDYGSGNAGTTNVMRVAGVVPGILTFVCDALKGFLAGFAGKMMFSYILGLGVLDWTLPIYGAYICGLACFLGHILPVFFQFKGGKGVATSVGIFYVCCPLAISLGLCVFALMVIITRTVSLSSIIATIVAITLSIIFYDRTASILPQAVLSIMIGSLVIIKHKDNIKRIFNGTEKKLSVKRSK